jgi:hypothetical protein
MQVLYHFISLFNFLFGFSYDRGLSDVAQAGLDFLASTSQGLRLQMCATMPSYVSFYKRDLNICRL